MIVGTAGHIDHGKTALVQALTGVDTDRLPEEKARGITIELGYAYAPLGDATSATVGFVDVPGHEQLVRTMVAGATGIDFALLVVAADDGVMPQTIEHANILALLGMARGLVAITKIDLVDAARVAAVEGQVRALLADGPLAMVPIMPVSTRTGAGVAPLRAALADAAAQPQLRAAIGAHAFRLAVDRSFTLPGAGTVVTGSVHSGTVAPGARLTVVPAQRPVRVRELRAQNRVAAAVVAGDRGALNLADVARDEVVRGDWVVDPAVALATQRVDATCFALTGAGRVLRSGASVHLYVGAAHVTARLFVLAAGDEASVMPGVPAFVQLVTAAPIAAWHGDRCILRDAADARTLGGGMVLDPFAPVRYRRTPARLAVLAALTHADASQRFAALLPLQADGVDIAQFARAAALVATALELPVGVRRIRASGIDQALDAAAWQQLHATLLQSLQAFHARQPDEMGPDARRLQRIAFPRVAAATFAALVADALATGAVRQAGPWLHLPAHDNALAPAERALFEQLAPAMRVVPFDPPWVRDHAAASGAGEKTVRTLLHRAAQRGEVFQVVRDLFYPPQSVRELADIAAAIQDERGAVDAGAFRDRTGLGRKRAIQILEFFDRVGFTRRVKDTHVLRSDTLRHVGAPAAIDIGTTTGAHSAAA